MVRVTTREVVVGDVTLPEGCEVVVCPFVAHRDPERFPEPSRCLPSRWRVVRPSPFEYLPFGAGAHGCIGQALARHLLGRALAHVLVHHDLVLACDQAIDWRVHIMLMPSVDAEVVVRAPDAPGDGGGRLLGPAAELLGVVDST
jgi:cytochrome P450